MARREGLYEVDGELVSERTPPVRWRALSYTQPMSERVPGRGKGKLMRVMFDSNTPRFAPLSVRLRIVKIELGTRHSPNEELDRGEIEPSLGAGDCPLEVFGEAAVAIKPGQ